MTNGRFRGAATLLVVGALCVSACSGAPTTPAPPTAATSASAPQPSSTTTAGPTTTPSAALAVGTWTVTSSMITARAEFTATLLPNGRVLVAGGIPDNTEQVQLASAELYDPSTGKWSATGSMSTPRSKHTATLLANGKVLVAGGFCAPLGPGGGATKGCPAQEDLDGAIANAELYDPATGKWTATGSMSTARFLHTATLLADGNVLVAGAEHRDGILASAEIYTQARGSGRPPPA